MSIIRVKEGVQSTVYDEHTQSYVGLVGGVEFDSNDPVVRAFPWAFETDADADARSTSRRATRRTEVETTDATPGTKRNR